MKAILFILCFLPFGLSGQSTDYVDRLVSNPTFYSPSYDPNQNPQIETGTLVYLNRNDRITIAKQAKRMTKTNIVESGDAYMMITTDISYVTKYGVNVPEDAVILFKLKDPKK